MLPPEARWFRSIFARYSDDELFPMLNVGGSGALMQRRVQPWIEQDVLSPLRRRGRIINVDLFPGEGVDYAGDIADAAFVARLARENVKSILCSNVLEHVQDPVLFAQRLRPIVQAGGLIFLSVPNQFPYHPDPIDTMFRPTPAELAGLFPNSDVETADLIDGGTLVSYTLKRAFRDPGAFLNTIRAREAAPANKAQTPLREFLPWLVRRFRVSCAVLRAKPAVDLRSS
jgi:hypothetical protein